MSLAELKAHVFVLIDLEAFDPEAVHRAVAAVPGGRRYFDRMKTALDLAKLLPVEEPPADRDAVILRTSSK